MLRSQSHQGNFFDQAIFARMIPEDHPLTRIKELVDFSFVSEAVAHLYHPDTGRPCIPPETLFRALFLEVWGDLSDVQVCRELGYNVLYRWFCGLGWDDPAPDDSTLVVFRRRLGEETFQKLFAQVVEQAREKGCLRGHWAIVDGTKVVAHVAVKNTLELAREGRKRLVKAVSKIDPQRGRELEPFAEPLPDGDYAGHVQLLAAEVARGKELVDKLREERAPEVAEVRETYQGILEGRGVVSFSDQDARWGFKKKDQPFLGYKVHAVCDEKGIVTAVRVTPGNGAEIDELRPMVDELAQRGLKPLRAAADKGYDAFSVREGLGSKEIRAYIPARHDLERLKRQGFSYDRQRETLTCRAGKIAAGRSPHQKGGFTYYFSEKDCKTCAFKESCAGKKATRKRIYVNPGILKYRARGIKVAMRLRKTVERVFGDAKVWHGMARARYRGLMRVTVQVLMTFIVTNVKKMVQNLSPSSPMA